MGNNPTLQMPEGFDIGSISDGYHSFNELYMHRSLLFVSLLNTNKSLAWKSKLHDDGTMFGEKWFIAGLNLPHGVITYHLEVDKYWEILDVNELETAPEWDGHTSEDVLNRLVGWNNVLYGRAE